MSIFKKIFGRKEENPAPRNIRSVNDLQCGDMITINDSFALPPQLRGQQMQVQSVNSYDYDGDKELEWVLKGADDTLIFLSLDEDDGVSLELSIKLKLADVETLFDLDNFADIFEDNDATTLIQTGDVERLSQWYTSSYRQSNAGETGFFHKKDHRDKNTPLGKGEQFELFTLDDPEEDFGVCIEVWNDGETDVSLTLYRPASDIVDFFPGS